MKNEIYVNKPFKKMFNYLKIKKHLVTLFQISLIHTLTNKIIEFHVHINENCI